MTTSASHPTAVDKNWECYGHPTHQVYWQRGDYGEAAPKVCLICHPPASPNLAVYSDGRGIPMACAPPDSRWINVANGIIPS